MTLTDHPLVARARQLASELLVPEAERLAREGMFLLIQGQTAETREAHLRALSER
ncbi:hypothetical protein [Streptomyces sp. NPDC004286]|uniref:hypothetical protein n=1 Tax=Streptomyces sp. NPDC004286 TaxID=3364696 RepID=UPI0036AE256F